MANESLLREKAYLKSGCNSFDGKRPMSNPMAFWTTENVLEYLAREKLPIADVYGNIVYDNESWRVTSEPRTGCMFCGFGMHLEKSPNKYQRLRLSHPRQYQYCLDKLGFRSVLDFMKISYK